MNPYEAPQTSPRPQVRSIDTNQMLIKLGVFAFLACAPLLCVVGLIAAIQLFVWM